MSPFSRCLPVHCNENASTLLYIRHYIMMLINQRSAEDNCSMFSSLLSQNTMGMSSQSNRLLVTPN